MMLLLLIANETDALLSQVTASLFSINLVGVKSQHVRNHGHLSIRGVHPTEGSMNQADSRHPASEWHPRPFAFE